MRHELNPIALSFGGMVLSWYWLSYFLGLALVLALGLWAIKRYQTLSSHTYLTFLQWGLPAMLVSSRLFYVCFYYPEYFLKNPSMIPQFWHGGMSFHGALLGPLLVGLFLAKKTQTPFFRLTDLVFFGLPWALFFGRLANFINGELYGRPTTLPWGFYFPLAEFHDGLAQLRHPSQLYQAATEGILLGLFLFFQRHRLNEEKAQTALFFIGYGALRFLVEFTREPDPQRGTFLALSLGQYLCLLMIIIGVVLWSKRKRETKLSSI